MVIILRGLFSEIVLIAFLIAVWQIFSLNDFSKVSAQPENEISAAAAAASRENAYRANNIGVAQLEQFNYSDAAESFRRALAIDPKLAIAQINLAIALFNLQEIDSAQAAASDALRLAPDRLQPVYLLGLIARSQNRTEEAVNYFQRVLAVDAQDVGANVNLGQIYIQQRRYEEAGAFFRRALEAEPYNSTALYNLATVLLRTEARAEGQRLMARFQALRNSGAATAVGQNYLEQGRYAEAVASTGAETGLVDKTEPKVTFQETNVGLPLARPKNSAAFNDAVLFDADGDGDLDLATANPAGIFRNDGGKFADATAASGDFARAQRDAGLRMVAGDFDNDNLPDLFVARGRGYSLYKNLGKGRFADVTAKAGIPAKPDALPVRSCAFADADHDGDLDVFVGGTGKTGSRLFRNNGDATFADYSKEAKIDREMTAAGIVPTDYDNRRDVDLLVLPSGENPVLFRNLRDTTFRDVAQEVGLNRKAAWTSVAAGDFNKDGFVDFFFGRRDARGVFAVSDARGKFQMRDAPAGTESGSAAQFFDHDNDGLLDLLVNTPKGLVVSRNLGGDGKSGGDWSAASGKIFKTNTDIAGSNQILSADVDGDGDVDLLVFDKKGTLRFLRNDGGSANNAEILRLQGRVSNRTAVGAKIDLRAGSLAQKLETYAASPAPAPSEVHFGLGKREKPDAVRVIWTSGVVQAEVEFPEKTAKNFQPFKIEELDRKPSSCPYLYAWNGEKFEFVTDFLGGGEMGNWQSAGAYHYPDSDEYVRITSEQLKPKNGRYEIRVTNELEEVLFLDHLKLVAVEHDREAEVYPNEGLGIPTAGRQILYTTRDERPPLSAADGKRKNVLPEIEKLDRRFYDSFKSLNIRGYAETHELTLKLDAKKDFRGRTLLLLTGWTDYAFSSDNLAASQSGKSLFLPKLQVRDERGEWRTVVESIGIAVGRPQTIVVDLTGKFLSASREVRIVTNFKTYWDKIAVDTSEQASVETVELPPTEAVLRERGFSREIKYGEMIAADYETVLKDARWKYFSGSFTGTGAVASLLRAIDDVFVISKTGDELVLSFEALPAPRAGKKYTFLLYADGYSKEMDINSGSPDAVFPLPFKGMKKYPYDAASEQFPMTEEKRRIYDEYTTRTVKAILPRLETSLLK
ncbi:MAG TPA: FG-GAP-like repeat-containing protein [Pyrinomonadaceae bacterium]|nr:FG-GAP-like repeat-containing protein [Pyrinomonadaceae bacterium]